MEFEHFFAHSKDNFRYLFLFKNNYLVIPLFADIFKFLGKRILIQYLYISSSDIRQFSFLLQVFANFHFPQVSIQTVLEISHYMHSIEIKSVLKNVQKYEFEIG
jgi:hypothetical protein